MRLEDFFELHPMAAIAFSGGVDSAYLLYAAVRCGAEVRAYYVKSDFQPQFELEDARRLAAQLQVEMTVLPVEILACGEVAANQKDRCYHCKKKMFGAIAHAAKESGFSLLLDGTNASDDAKDRPGMKALEELQVLSPLRECSLTKEEVRRLSREAGLFTWDKPAYACLATRIPFGDPVTKEKLQVTERAEAYLSGLGFSDLRVRWMDGAAKIQVREEQTEKLLDHREEIIKELRKYYTSVLLDMEARK